jgi:hypothetical protein
MPFTLAVFGEGPVIVADDPLVWLNGLRAASRTRSNWA